MEWNLTMRRVRRLFLKDTEQIWHDVLTEAIYKQNSMILSWVGLTKEATLNKFDQAAKGISINVRRVFSRAKGHMCHKNLCQFLARIKSNILC